MLTFADFRSWLFFLNARQVNIEYIYILYWIYLYLFNIEYFHILFRNDIYDIFGLYLMTRGRKFCSDMVRDKFLKSFELELLWSFQTWDSFQKWIFYVSLSIFAFLKSVSNFFQKKLIVDFDNFPESYLRPTNFNVSKVNLSAWMSHLWK